MKKLSFLIAFAAFVSQCVFAQIAVWRNGEVVYETEYAIDSISLIHNRDHSIYDFSTIGHVQERITGLYYQFGRDKSYRNRLVCGFQGLNTDIEYNYRGYSTGSSITQITQYALTSDGSPDLSAVNGNDPWNALTTLIHEAGLIIDGIREHCDTMDVNFAYALGEVLTLRSFGYLEMIKLWGDIPIEYFEPLANSGADSVLTPKVDRNQVFERIRTDLKQAAILMPWSEECPNIGNLDVQRLYTDGYRVNEATNRHFVETESAPCNYTGRPSRAAALALLARADLMYAGKAVRPDTWIVGGGSSYSVQYNIPNAAKRKDIYQEVLQVCAQIINHESYKLLPDYAEIFKRICADVTNYQQSEVIWEIPFNNNVRGQFMQYNMLRVENNAAGKLINTYNSGNTDYTRSNQAVAVVPTFYYDFEQGDIRRDVTVSPYRWDYSNNNLPYFEHDYALYQRINQIHRLYLGKYRAEWMNRMCKPDDGVNYPIIRFADVLLMFSEASIGGISGDVPANYTGIDGNATFNQVRARAGLAPKTLTMDNLMKERAFEFCGEYIRKYDLMRWGLLKDKMVETTNRLQNLAAHTGEFAQLSDTVYVKYRRDDSYCLPGVQGLVIEEIWGLNKGEIGRPANYDPQNGWTRVDIYHMDEDPYLRLYKLYENAATIDGHQYWPIFPYNLQNSQGNLWNDYSY